MNSHTLPRLQLHARHLFMKWLILRDGSATAFPPSFLQGGRREIENDRKKRERRLIAHVSCKPLPSLTQTPPHPLQTHQISSAWLVFCVINLPCLCLYAIVLVLAAIFVRSLVEGRGITREKKRTRRGEGRERWTDRWGRWDWEEEEDGGSESEGWSDRGDLTDRKQDEDEEGGAVYL